MTRIHEGNAIRAGLSPLRGSRFLARFSSGLRHWLNSIAPAGAGCISICIVEQRRARKRTVATRRAALLLAAAAICCGCAQEPDKLERFVPAPELAERALEAVLADWKAGKPPGSIDRLAVKVHITDNQRKPGQLLDDFEILGEVPSATVRCFAVRLKLREPLAEEKVRYAVFGIDPLWVFRQEDLEMLGHWEHPMPAEEPASAKVADQVTANAREEENANEQSEEPPRKTSDETEK